MWYSVDEKGKSFTFKNYKNAKQLTKKCQIMQNKYKLCLNLNAVRERMRTLEMSKKELGQKIGMKDPHTIAYYFEHPDRIRLNHVTAIAATLGAQPYTYEDYIVRVSSDKELADLVEGRAGRDRK